MRNLMISFASGCAVASAIFYFLIVPEIRDSYRAVGFNDGTISAKLDVAQKVKGVLGRDFSTQEPHQPLFEVKSTAVVVVERNGVKTIRVVE
jgi:hypothetical protein